MQAYTKTVSANVNWMYNCVIHSGFLFQTSKCKIKANKPSKFLQKKGVHIIW